MQRTRNDDPRVRVSRHGRFTQIGVVAGTTAIRAIHMTELRIAVDAVRAAVGLLNATYTNAITVGAFIRVEDVTELRARLGAPRDTLGLTPVVYVDPSLTGGMIVRAAHIQELRNATKPVIP